jgi:hypothetical protein
MEPMISGQPLAGRNDGVTQALMAARFLRQCRAQCSPQRCAFGATRLSPHAEAAFQGSARSVGMLLRSTAFAIAVVPERQIGQ